MLIAAAGLGDSQEMSFKVSAELLRAAVSATRNLVPGVPEGLKHFT
jgi:hypothetical protein